jgi:hypothetical protein
MDESKLASTPTNEIQDDPPPSPVFNPEDLIGRSYLWIIRKKTVQRTHSRTP